MKDRIQSTKCWRRHLKWLVLGMVVAIVLLVAGIMVLMQSHSPDTPDDPVTLECWQDSETTEDTTTLILPSDRCNEDSFTTLNLTQYKKLVYLEIGDDSFQFVEEIHLSGLELLGKVVIGKNSFTAKNGSLIMKGCSLLKELEVRNNSLLHYRALDIKGNDALEAINIAGNSFSNGKELELVGYSKMKRVIIGDNSFGARNGRFVLKDCPLVTQLRIGTLSFVYFSTCVIENTPSLEVIEMGDLDINHDCSNFYASSLELRGLSENGVSRRYAETAIRRIWEVRVPHRCLRQCACMGGVIG